MFENILFMMSALLTIIGTILVIFNKNIMHCCLSLFMALFGIAGLYASMGAEFLAAIQLFVYAGGVIILMIFAVMLTGGNGTTSNKFGIKKVAAMGNVWTYSLAFLTSLTMLFSIAAIIKANFGRELANLPPFQSMAKNIGRELMTDHILAFEISSILLLGALIGAAIIARPIRSQGK